uniref:Uncharacterized protein n=1 Tax=Sipha flava TaxID=143950 RepID=A0A2S2QLS8_9HEMI
MYLSPFRKTLRPHSCGMQSSPSTVRCSHYLRFFRTQQNDGIKISNASLSTVGPFHFSDRHYITRYSELSPRCYVQFQATVRARFKCYNNKTTLSSEPNTARSYYARTKDY